MVWFTGGGNGDQFQYSCPKNPMTSMKSQKDMRKVSLSGWKVSNMLLGKSWRQLLIISEKNRDWVKLKMMLSCGCVWFRIEKRVHQGCLLSLFNLYADHIMRNTGMDELKAGIRIGRRNVNSLTYADGRKWRGTKEPLAEGEGGEGKSWLKTKY